MKTSISFFPSNSLRLRSVFKRLVNRSWSYKLPRSFLLSGVSSNYNSSTRNEVQTMPTAIQTLLIGGFVKDYFHLKPPTWQSAWSLIKVSWIEFVEKLGGNYFFCSFLTKADEWFCPIRFSSHAMVTLLKFFQYSNGNFHLKGMILKTQNKN